MFLKHSVYYSVYSNFNDTRLEAVCGQSTKFTLPDVKTNSPGLSSRFVIAALSPAREVLFPVYLVIVETNEGELSFEQVLGNG